MCVSLGVGGPQTLTTLSHGSTLALPTPHCTRASHTRVSGYHFTAGRHRTAEQLEDVQFSVQATALEAAQAGLRTRCSRDRLPSPTESARWGHRACGGYHGPRRPPPHWVSPAVCLSSETAPSLQATGAITVLPPPGGTAGLLPLSSPHPPPCWPPGPLPGPILTLTTVSQPRGPLGFGVLGHLPQPRGLPEESLTLVRTGPPARAGPSPCVLRRACPAAQ